MNEDDVIRLEQRFDFSLHQCFIDSRNNAPGK